MRTSCIFLFQLGLDSTSFPPKVSLKTSPSSTPIPGMGSSFSWMKGELLVSSYYFRLPFPFLLLLLFETSSELTSLKEGGRLMAKRLWSISRVILLRLRIDPSTSLLSVAILQSSMRSWSLLSMAKRNLAAKILSLTSLDLILCLILLRSLSNAIDFFTAKLSLPEAISQAVVVYPTCVFQLVKVRKREDNLLVGF